MTPSGVGCAGGSRDADASRSSTEAAFYVCALASYDEIRAMIARYDRTSTGGLLLSATAWQCKGDVLRAESALRRAAETVSEEDRPYVVDLLAPLLVSRGMFARAAALLGTIVHCSWFEAGRLALRAVIDAAAGNIKLSADLASAAREALGPLDDDALRLRVHQRLAMAAYYRGHGADALDEVARGLRSARLLAAHRAACTLHSVAYATYYSMTGDFDAAWRQACAIAREADLGGDESYRALGRVAIYELAAERGDDAEVAAARAALESEPLPEQYRERFSGGIADVLRLGWRGEFATCRNVLIVLKDTSGRTDCERALCRALLALVSVALGDDDAARRFSRQAISTSARPQKHIVAYEMRYRRLARALAAIVGDFVGDVVRGKRAADACFLRDDADVTALLGLRSGSLPDRMPASVRGYARLIDAVRETLVRRPSVGPLTDSEAEILKMLAAGRNAPQIAAILSRSPHTVRTHIRNASAKLEARGRVDMLARARQLGIVAEPR
jgi:DNA-binding CsgD family transcriptional regulator